MTRDEFEEFLLRLLWRKGDTDLTDDLPHIIRLGEARLNRDLMVLKRQKTMTLQATSSLIPYEPDYQNINLLADETGPWAYVTPDEWARLVGCKSTLRGYTLDGDGVRLTKAFTAEAPGNFALYYTAKLPAYEDDETWVQQDYFDIYSHACLINSAPYLQADERIQVWTGFYNEALESVKFEDAARRYNASPLRSRHPGIVG